MKTNADVVVVGGGIIGMAVAFYLAKADYGDIVVVEKDAVLGAGATSKAAGGIRAQFNTRVNVEMSMLSEKLFEQFNDDTGYDALFDQVGYMFLVSDEKDAETYRKAYELQKSLGLPVEMLQAGDVSEYAPHVRTDDVIFATFCRKDGLGDPHEFLSGYDHACRKMGVEINAESEVTGITVDGGKVKSVKTSKGIIETPHVINCAGPWAKQIAKFAGSSIPVEPYRRQIVTTGELSFVEPFFPMVVDVASGLYCHKESKGMLLGWADKSVAPSFDVSIDPEYTDGILERALDRIPQLEEAEIANQWAGLYETTPDHRAIIGPDRTVEGLFHVTGFSGHGFMHAPGAGMVTAEMLTGKEPSVDVSDLSPERFAKGELVEETNVI